MERSTTGEVSMPVWRSMRLGVYMNWNPKTIELKRLLMEKLLEVEAMKGVLREKW